MKQKKVETVVKLIPDILGGISNYLKKSTSAGLKAASENTSTVGLFVKVFAQPLIDNYFSKVEKDKLKDLGALTYLQAALLQASASLQSSVKLEQEYSIDGLIIGFERALQKQFVKTNTEDYTLFFQPKFHPLIVEVVDMVVNFLKEINRTNQEIDQFRKHFFDEIELQVANVFGKEIYDKHLKEVRGQILNENETHLLSDNLKLSKIGFKEDEYLKYETTYAEWKPVSSLWSGKEENSGINYRNNTIKSIDEREKSLLPIELLIDQYFDRNPLNHLQKVLFVVADFGKGKSVFLRHMTARLTKDFISFSNNYFPIYFNLRNYKDYSEEHFLGVIGNFLEKKYGIKITDDYFKNRRYFFLIDSLDESGELSTNAINKVIESVTKIQSLNPIDSNKNKIIITTRPFDEGLKSHLQRHDPFIQANEQNRPVEFFISIYGFKRKQFNDWLINSIRRLVDKEKIQAEGLNKQVLDSVKNEAQFDIYNEFLERKILSPSELRRPIFSYMILQMISKSISFDKAGKVGVYLSFINLLTKEAKYLHDNQYRVDLREQFKARNILHSTSAVWLYNKNSNNTSEIKKADVCRVLEEDNINSDDAIVLREYRAKKETEIEFLSHSYFGESNNTLHFHHQSFAEILLAEYYVKVLLTFALDKKFNYEKARLRLSLGEPPTQVLLFFKELIILIKDSATNSTHVLEKRKLIFPLLASLATIENNKSLYSSHLAYTWFDRLDFLENSSEIPKSALQDWPITSDVINKILELCKNILESENVLQNIGGEFKDSLFNKEVFVTKKSESFINIDKWISFVTGNLFYNNEVDEKWFNKDCISSTLPFDLLLESNKRTIPQLFREFFVGLDLSKNNKLLDLSSLNLHNIDFSYSFLRGISFNSCNLYNVKFYNCHLEFCTFSSSSLYGAKFINAIIFKSVHFELATIQQGVFFPYKLAEMLCDDGENEKAFGHEFIGMFTNFGEDKARLEDKKTSEIAAQVGGIMKYGYKEGFWTKAKILDAFIFTSKQQKMSFDIALGDALNIGHVDANALGIDEAL